MKKLLLTTSRKVKFPMNFFTVKKIKNGQNQQQNEVADFNADFYTAKRV